MKKLKVAVVGAGIYGMNHVRGYLQNPHVKSVAVCDRNDQIRDNIDKEYGLKTYADITDMLEKEDLDAISIATPDQFHVEPSLAAISEGIPILVEKPLATTVDDSRKIINAAKKRNTLLAVDFHKRWDPVAINVYNYLNDKKNGYPIRGYMSMDDIIDVPTKWFDWAHDSSPVHFLGIHCFDLIRWYMGCEAVEVYAMGSKKLLSSKGIDTYDSIQSIIKFENGCTWVVENSWVLPSGFPKANDGKTSIITSESYIRVDSQERGVQFFDQNKQMTPNVYFFNEWNGKQFGFGMEPINDFIDSVVYDKEFLADGNDGLEASKIAEAVHESLSIGETIKIEKEE